MTDEQVLEHWDREVPVAHPISMALAECEGTLRGIASCLKDAAEVISSYSGFGDDMKFFAREIEIVQEKIEKVRNNLYA